MRAITLHTTTTAAEHRHHLWMAALYLAAVVLPLGSLLILAHQYWLHHH